jgi:hypothetical protein
MCSWDYATFSASPPNPDYQCSISLFPIFHIHLQFTWTKASSHFWKSQYYCLSGSKLCNAGLCTYKIVLCISIKTRLMVSIDSKQGQVVLRSKVKMAMTHYPNPKGPGMGSFQSARCGWFIFDVLSSSYYLHVVISSSDTKSLAGCTQANKHFGLCWIPVRESWCCRTSDRTCKCKGSESGRNSGTRESLQHQLHILFRQE